MAYTRSGQGSAQGYLTASSARVFGAALARQFRADHGRDSYGRDGLFAGGVSITLAGVGAAARAGTSTPARPDFPMHTLTVTGTNLRGQPDTGDLVTVFNVSNPDAFGNAGSEAYNTLYHGKAEYSVPAGRYWAVGFFESGNSARWVVLPQFTVRGDHTTVHVAERSATSQLTVTTPRPTSVTSFFITLTRGGPSGTPAIFGVFGQLGHGSSFWTNPTTVRPTVGTLQWYTYLQLTSPAKAAGTPYAYNLGYAAPAGLIPSLRYVVTPGSLATVTERYYQDVRTTGLWVTAGGYPADLATDFEVVGLYPLRLPGPEIQYMLASRGLVWGSAYLEFNQSYGKASYGGGQSDSLHVLRPGEQVTESWNEFPLHPQPDVSLLSGGAARPVPVLASASRAGDLLSLDLTPFSDNQLGHVGCGFVPTAGRTTGTYAIRQNGAMLARGNAVNGMPVVRLSPKQAQISLTLNAARRSSYYLLSPASTTTWTWRSARPPRAVVPAGWYCSIQHGRLQRSCAVQPLLTLNYQVQGLALDGTAPAGPQAIGLTVGHLQLASAAPVTNVAAWFSLDGGRTWQPATVTSAGGGQFGISFTAPPGTDVTLRTSASDSAGNSVTETITDGYRVGATGPTGTTDPARAGRGRPGAGGRLQAACPPTAPGHLRCFALYRPQYAVNRAIAAGITGTQARPSGLTPREIESAYRLPVSRRSGQTVAVSIVGNTPHLAAYLAHYRKYFGLPPCTTASKCLRIVNQKGQASPLPPSSLHTGWDVEATLDVSMISASCPTCKILVVEATNDLTASLAKTEWTAARLGAQVISNSYGQRENGFAMAYRHAYHQPGHTIVVATGDGGFTAAQFPADLSTVTAVGGTQLSRARNARGWSERVWNTPRLGAGGSGCSAYVAKPAWQHDPHCLPGTPERCSTSPTATTRYPGRHRGLAGAITCAWPGRATTPPPAWEHRTAPAPFDPRARHQAYRRSGSGVVVRGVRGRAGDAGLDDGSGPAGDL